LYAIYSLNVPDENNYNGYNINVLMKDGDQ